MCLIVKSFSTCHWIRYTHVYLCWQIHFTWKGDSGGNPCMRHGAFGWFELMTTDVEAAKAFYKGLFGWEYDTVPIPGSEYTMGKVDDDPVAGIMAMSYLKK